MNHKEMILDAVEDESEIDEYAAFAGGVKFALEWHHTKGRPFESEEEFVEWIQDKWSEHKENYEG